MKPPPFVQHLARTDLPTEDGGSIALQSEIPVRFAWAMYKTVLHLQPDAGLEIGMATGSSTLAILSAMDAVGKGHLTTIDPNQSGPWRGAGRVAVAYYGLSERNTILEQPDFLALPQLVEAGKRFQFAYVDGWHTFDYVALDVFFIDKVLDVDGVIGFNDCSLPAVRKVIRLLTTHRRYEEMDVGLLARGGSTPARTVLNTILNRRTSDRYFRKREDWEPSWNYYKHF